MFDLGDTVQSLYHIVKDEKSLRRFIHAIFAFFNMLFNVIFTK